MTKKRYTKWTEKDREIMAWLLCDFVDYSSEEWIVLTDRQGRRYKERKKCGKPCRWIVERFTKWKDFDHASHRCDEHKAL